MIGSSRQADLLFIDSLAPRCAPAASVFQFSILLWDVAAPGFSRLRYRSPAAVSAVRGYSAVPYFSLEDIVSHLVPFLRSYGLHLLAHVFWFSRTHGRGFAAVAFGPLDPDLSPLFDTDSRQTLGVHQL